MKQIEQSHETKEQTSEVKTAIYITAIMISYLIIYTLILNV